MRRAFAWLVWIALAPGAARAAAPAGSLPGSIDGRILLEPGFVPDEDDFPGLWRIDNGLLPIAPPLVDPRNEMIVTVEGVPPPEGGAGGAGGTAILSVRDVRLWPPVLAVRTGTTVEFRNEDRIVHTLFAPGRKDSLPPQPQAPGGVRTHKFGAHGVYPLRCAEVPHVQGTLLVFSVGAFAPVDAQGRFKVDGLPAGARKLWVWYRDRRVFSRTVDVPAAGSSEVELRLASAAGQKAEPKTKNDKK